MTSLINADTGIHITKYVSMKQNQEVILVTKKTLDGRVHNQRIGKPTIFYKLEVYVDHAGKIQIEHAQNKGSLLQVSVKRGVFLGRIIDISEFEKILSTHFKVEITLAKEVEAEI